MSITVTLNCETPELLAAQVAWLHAKLGGAEVIAEVKARKTAKEAIDKAQSKPEPVAPAAATPEEPIRAAEAKTPDPQEATAPGVTTDELRSLLLKYDDKHGSGKAKEILVKYKAKFAKDLSDSDRVAVKGELEAGLV